MNPPRQGAAADSMAWAPLCILTQKQTRDALGIPYRRVQKLIRFDRDEVMAWAQRWSQNTKDLGIDVQAAPGDQRRSLRQALAPLPVLITDFGSGY